MGTMVLQQRPQHVYVPPDEPDPDALDPSLFLPAWRPWLALYGARIRFGGHTTSSVVRIHCMAAFLHTQSVCSIPCTPHCKHARHMCWHWPLPGKWLITPGTCFSGSP